MRSLPKSDGRTFSFVTIFCTAVPSMNVITEEWQPGMHHRKIGGALAVVPGAWALWLKWAGKGAKSSIVSKLLLHTNVCWSEPGCGLSWHESAALLQLCLTGLQSPSLQRASVILESTGNWLHWLHRLTVAACPWWACMPLSGAQAPYKQALLCCCSEWFRQGKLWGGFRCWLLLMGGCIDH